MKIVNRKQFLELPAETVFSYYKPRIFYGLFIKCSYPGQYENDFLYDDLIMPIYSENDADWNDLIEEAEQGKSVEVDFNYTGRDGMFIEEQLFAVYEGKDVSALIDRLSQCL